MRMSPAGMEMTSPPVVKIDGVGKTFDGVEGPLRVLDDVGFELCAGEFVSVIGPSGCGKSTLLRIIAGLLPYQEGVAGVHLKSAPDGRPTIGMAFQTPALLPWKNAIDNVLAPIRIAGLNAGPFKSRALALLELVGLGAFAGFYPKQLSGGMQQRVSLCRSLIHEPPLLLMDEPFGALDALTREQLNVELQKLWMVNRTTVLFVTHSISEAVFLSDRVLVMSSRPGHLAGDFSIPIPRPRSWDVRTEEVFVHQEALIRRRLEEVSKPSDFR